MDLQLVGSGCAVGLQWQWIVWIGCGSAIELQSQWMCRGLAADAKWICNGYAVDLQCKLAVGGSAVDLYVQMICSG